MDRSKCKLPAITIGTLVVLALVLAAFTAINDEIKFGEARRESQARLAETNQRARELGEDIQRASGGGSTSDDLEDARKVDAYQQLFQLLDRYFLTDRGRYTASSIQRADIAAATAISLAADETLTSDGLGTVVGDLEASLESLEPLP